VKRDEEEAEVAFVIIIDSQGSSLTIHSLTTPNMRAIFGVC
jgi:hypothetical protein